MGEGVSPSLSRNGSPIANYLLVFVLFSGEHGYSGGFNPLIFVLHEVSGPFFLGRGVTTQVTWGEKPESWNLDLGLTDPDPVLGSLKGVNNFQHPSLDVYGYSLVEAQMGEGVSPSLPRHGLFSPFSVSLPIQISILLGSIPNAIHPSVDLVDSAMSEEFPSHSRSDDRPGFTSLGCELGGVDLKPLQADYPKSWVPDLDVHSLQSPTPSTEYMGQIWAEYHPLVSFDGYNGVTGFGLTEIISPSQSPILVLLRPAPFLMPLQITSLVALSDLQVTLSPKSPFPASMMPLLRFFCADLSLGVIFYTVFFVLVPSVFDEVWRSSDSGSGASSSYNQGKGRGNAGYGIAGANVASKAIFGGLYFQGSRQSNSDLFGFGYCCADEGSMGMFFSSVAGGFLSPVFKIHKSWIPVLGLPSIGSMGINSSRSDFCYPDLPVGSSLCTDLLHSSLPWFVGSHPPASAMVCRARMSNVLDGVGFFSARSCFVGRHCYRFRRTSFCRSIELSSSDT